MVGDARGTAGAGVTGWALGRTTGASGFGDGREVGALVGAGEGATVGGGFRATATGATVGMLMGAAGNDGAGRVSKILAVGCGLGCGVCCGIGRGFGGALGAVFASS